MPRTSYFKFIRYDFLSILVVLCTPYLVPCTLYLVLFVPSTSLFAQQINLPLNRQWGLNLERLIQQDSAHKTNFHTNFKPYVENNFFDLATYNHENENLENKTPSGSPPGLFMRKLRWENLVIVNDTSEKFHLTLDPLFNFEFGKDLKSANNQLLYQNTRGILIRGDIGKKFSFESSFYENQATFVNYIDQFNNTYNVIPGQGRWKPFKSDGYDFAMASGYISYSPNRHFNAQFGSGKNFVGDGYRSLLLSDNAFNYPYVRITSSFGRLQYTNLYAVLMNLGAAYGYNTPNYTNPNAEILYQRKAANFQVLSWNVNKRIELGLFQAMIWQATDSMNRQHLNFYYFNPVIYTDMLRYGLNNTNNILLGYTLKVNVTKSSVLYGQYMLDDYSDIAGSVNNRNGYQLGLKMFDLFHIRNLHFQAEYNQVRPYAYTSDNAEQSYTHYNQSLADPLGANFKEFISFLDYRLGDFFVELKFNYAIIGADSSGKNFGSNIFKSDNTAYYGANSTNNQQGQGVKTILMYNDFRVGYLVNPATNLNIIVGILNRVESVASNKNTTDYIYIGIRTSLTNVYYDF